jgi:hypothetical protein
LGMSWGGLASDAAVRGQAASWLMLKSSVLR